MENYSKMSNDDLVRWCRDHNWRDEAAAKILFERTYPLISAVVRAKKYRKEWPLLGLDPVDGPQVAVQDIVLKVFRSLKLPPESPGGYKSQGKYPQWVSRIAKWTMYDMLRQGRTRTVEIDGMRVAREVPLPESEALEDLTARERAVASLVDRLAGAHTSNPGDEAVHRVYLEQVRAILNRCLRELPENQRRVVVLYSRGYSHPEIAQILQKPLNSVKSWRSHGIEKLRLLLKELGLMDDMDDTDEDEDESPAGPGEETK